ncbi:YafY family transcriptional regulator [Enterococcus raffinosus]|uniref:helix-turn-helix transcriptional regulator n=1 Tax=Enterococcus raffinosus TaxID=71452 RepID=UPI001C1229CD|nr:YafY family protein [Enterococcus raffinosus]MBU5360599.1 YafY family transcriptional regulator [Enterococcus raffinosus]
MKMDRLLSITMLLLDKKRIGAKELAEKFEVSPRTIYRDIDILNLAGIPIRSTSGVGGGFEIMENYKMDKKVFSSADLSTILTSLSGFSNMMQGKELASALAKVKSFIPADRAKDIETKINQFNVDLSPWIGNRNLQHYIETIKSALQENLLLVFSYSDQHGRSSRRIIEPYQLILKNSQWYLQGYCLTKEDFRLFKVNRMTKLQMKEEHFVPREHQKPQLDFTEYLDAMQTTIKLRIHRSVMDMVLDYCTFENFSPDGDSHYIVDFPFIENDYYYNILFSFGKNCECLEPPQVRAEMKRKIKEIADLYD